MRKLALVGMIVLSAGCNLTPFAGLDKRNDGPVQPVPPVDKLVAYLNDNSSRIQSVRFQDVALVASMKSKVGWQSSPNLHATIAVQKDRNFRMQADFQSRLIVDLGSNDQEFWWLIQDPSNKSNGQPGVGEQLYCSYDDLEKGLARHWKIPLEPAWVIEVLGMGQYPADKYKVETQKETAELVQKTVMNGRAVRKVIVFQRRPKQAPYPTVSDYKLIDDNTNKLICNAHIVEIHLDSKNTNAILPKKIEIQCPEMDAELVLTMKYFEVNPGIVNPGGKAVAANPGRAINMDTFVRTPVGGVPQRNLAQYAPGDDIRRAQGDAGR
jgi:hypothetical protein